MDKIIDVINVELNKNSIEEGLAELAGKVDYFEEPEPVDTIVGKQRNIVTTLDKNYMFFGINNVMVQVKNGDSVDDVINNYNKRKVIPELEGHIDLINSHINSMNNLIVRIYEFIESNQEDYNEYKLIGRQIVNTSKFANFEHRKIADLLKKLNFNQVVPADEISNIDEAMHTINHEAIKVLEEYAYMPIHLNLAIREVGRKYD